MSEAERIRRQNYKRNRKRWILTQIVIIAIVASIALGSFLIYKRLDRTYYIEYTEQSSSNYEVHYKENMFFEEEWLPSGQSYVSALADEIRADFKYELNMDTSNVAFDYSYELTAQLVVSDKTSGAHIYNPTDVIVPKTTKSVSGSDNFRIKESALIDFASYNTTATQFINVYGLKNAKAALYVTLKIDVLSASDEFEMNNENTHSVSMLIPLCEQNFSIETMTGLPGGESKVLACKKDANQHLFLGIAIFMAALALLLNGLLIAFAYLTKNEDVDYANKVRKILNSYRSFIQRIDGEFDTAGYQLVPVKTFLELLSIRDTIQSPVLMCENLDETRSQFLIPTNTKILYLFEIKVDNYDELYANTNEPDTTDNAPKEETAEPIVETVYIITETEATEGRAAEATTEAVPAEETVAEETPAEETVAEETVAEETVTEEAAREDELDDIPLFDNTDLGELEEEISETDGNEDNDEEESDGSIIFYDENNNKLRIRCRRSCLANVIQSENETTKALYSELKNYILSFKGVKSRMSWRHESYKKGRAQLFKLKVRGKTICLFCALNPEEYDVNKYFHQTIESKAYEQVPMMVRIKNPGGLKRAKKLVDEVMAKFEIVNDPKYVTHDFIAEHPYERTQALIDRGLIKILIPDGYVVVDPRHIVKAEALKKLQEARAQKRAELAAEKARLAEEKRLAEEARLAEEKRLEEERLEKERLERERLEEEARKAEEARLAEEKRLEEERLEKERLEEEARKAEEARLAEEKRLEEERLEKERLEEERKRQEELQRSLEAAMAQPDLTLDEIDYVDEVDEEFVESEGKEGVEVVGVVWPERPHRNKIYRYDPNGEQLHENDVVLVPTRDVHKNREVIRKATVAHGNHMVDADLIKHPLKKIISVIKHRVEEALCADTKKPEPKPPKSRLGKIKIVKSADDKKSNKNNK